MTAVQKRRLRRRRRIVRNVKKLILNILLAPARMPRVTVQMAETAMHYCEVTGIIFVASLIGHMFNSALIGTFFVVLTAIAFISCLLIIKLSDYQYQLEQMSYYGFTL